MILVGIDTHQIVPTKEKVTNQWQGHGSSWLNDASGRTKLACTVQGTAAQSSKIVDAGSDRK